MFNLKKNRKYKTLYKKFLLLKTNINNDVKIFKFKKKKWKTFVTILKKKKRIKIKFKPFTNYDYIATKFASRGNSFENRFKHDLIAKKIFNYSYGNLLKKYLKKQMNIIYNSKEFYNYKLVCLKFFESRLDSVLYRSKFCYSVRNARHIISHKHVTINNKIEKNKGYILNTGDILRIRPSALKLIKHNIKKMYIPFQTNNRKRKRHLFNLELLWPIPPKYLIINYKTLELFFGNIKNFNFSIYFPLKLNLYSIIINYYRH